MGGGQGPCGCVGRQAGTGGQATPLPVGCVRKAQVSAFAVAAVMTFVGCADPLVTLWSAFYVASWLGLEWSLPRLFARAKDD